MSERKVLNKYYPPDFDPTKLPKLPKDRNRQFVIRIMAPFSMRCTTCGEYIYKGRKFNSRVETAEGENYLGLRIYRFYIRCTKCISEITFKTDPQNTDYVMEHGATRNFEAFKKMQKRVDEENQAILDEEENNPMKALENRTKDSKREMESIELLGELKDLNQRIASVDHDQLIEQHLKEGAVAISKQEADDEELVRHLFGGSGDPTSAGDYVSRILDDASSSDDYQAPPVKKKRTEELTSSTDVLTAEDDAPSLADAPGPSKPKPKPKVSLKIQPDISSMVKLIPKEVEVKNETDQPSTITATENTDSATLTDATVDEPAPLPAYKIVLPKTKLDNQSKMKGSSLSLLGGYSDSDSSDQSED